MSWLRSLLSVAALLHGQRHQVGRAMVSSASSRPAMTQRHRLPRNGLVVVLQEGDITKQDADAVVNAANTYMLGGLGVDGAIHRAAGKELLQTCRKLPIVDPPSTRLRTGDALLLPGFNLKAKYVIAAVGPIHGDYTVDESVLLFKSAHKRVLAIASEKSDISSVAFPALSCGIYGFPPKLAASTIMQLLADVDEKGCNVKEVRFILFGSEMFNTFADTAKSTFPAEEGERGEGGSDGSDSSGGSGAAHDAYGDASASQFNSADAKPSQPDKAGFRSDEL